MQKLRYSWLGIAALTLVLFSNLTLAIDNPDAPDLIAEFEFREKPLPKTMIGKLSRKDILVEEKEKVKEKELA